MEKVRVYDLAKELKMESKELVRSLQEMGVEVRNHMSLVSADDASQAREKLGAALNSVEETRVASTVIRRRRKATEPEESGEEQSETLAEPEDSPAEQAEAVNASSVPPLEQPLEKTQAAQEAKPVVAQETVPDKLEEALPEAAPAQEPKPAAPVQEGVKAPAAARPREAQPAAGRDDRDKRPEPKKGKGRVDTPARIISRPADTPARIVSMPEKEQQDGRRPFRGARPEAAGPSAARPPAPRPGVPAIAPGNRFPTADDSDMGEKDGARSRAGKKKGKKGPAFGGDDNAGNRVGAKRKEVFDKHDLYDTDGRGSRMRRGGPKKIKKTELTVPKAIKRRIKVGEVISASELAKRLGVKAAELIAKLMQMGMMVTANQALDVEEATLAAAEFGFEVEKVAFEEEVFLEQVPDAPEDLKIRPPVVTIMGHVDHGKTSLLDAIRRSHVTEGEAGGITQHIGAYDVTLPSGGHVVFVDTPGHAAFTQMRARGAQVTDVVVLVVAADDGVMQQTKEAINHSRAAEVPIVVAINKIDKPAADPSRVKRELMDQGLVGEEWGGDTIIMEVSAKTGQGLDDLLEMLLLQSEVLELRANPNKPARGRILEARLDKGRGPVATVLVQEGTLKPGDFFVSGVYAGKVRAMLNDLGQTMDSAGPSIPVEVQGLSGVPEAGDEFAVVESEKMARQIAEHRSFKKREAELSSKSRLSLEGFFEQMKEGEVQELNLVVKGDVQGSVEALIEALHKLGNEQVKINIIHAAAGAITETDIMLASASNAVLIGFNVRPNNKVAEMARAEKVDVRTYEIIYQIIDDVTAALTGMLAPIKFENVIGHAVVRETFSVPKLGTIAGCGVTSGKVERNALVRLLRDGVVVANTKVGSLRRFKEDVKEVAQGFECGIGLENYNDIKVGDELEFYVIKEKAAQL